MNTKEKEQTKVEEEEQVEEDELELRYGWGNEQDGAWYLTKKKHAFLPKGCRLLYKLYCRTTDEPMNTPTPWPEIGQVGQDVDGDKIKVVQIEWT